MKTLKGSFAAKLTAVILLVLCCAALCASFLGIWAMDDAGAYQGGGQNREELMDTYIHRQINGLVQSCINGMPVNEADDWDFRFDLLDAGQKLLYSNLGSLTPVYAATVNVSSWYSGLYYRDDNQPLDTEQAYATPAPVDGEDSSAKPNGTQVVYIRGYVVEEYTAAELSAQLALYDWLYGMRYALFAIAAVSLLLAVLLFVFLMSAAGHRDATDTVTPSFVEKIPADVLTAAVIFGIACLSEVIGQMDTGSLVFVTVGALCLIGMGLLVLLLLMSVAVHLKLGTLVKSCLIYQLLRGCWRLLKRLCRALGKLLRSLPLVWKWVLGVGVLALIDLIWRMGFRRDGDMQLFGWFFLWLFVGLALLYAVLCFRKLRLGAKEIAGGNEGFVIDAKYLRGDFKAHAEDLNNIRAGLSRAVDERMKSERFKTELITNVSHDIKTPLTSIVSYVDLLSKEEIESETAQGYIEVLSRQSAQLKKLIDDLMEASKASTGNLAVNLERCELGVLLEQTAGEFDEKLQKAGLELVLQKPDAPVTVMADSRHLWRIFDNLMNNVCKYAQPGTRVYLNLKQDSGRAEVSFRNISREQLNLEGAALMERFVRGDSSRNTEGSGLGLAIAKSLADLQGIGMDITVDGDLFKVVLGFQTVI